MRKATELVYLRALTTGDLDRVARWHNDPDLYATLAGHFRYISPETEAAWLRQRIEAQNEINLAVCLSESSEHIGNIYLRNIDWVDRNAELHVFIAECGNRGRGYGSAAIDLIARHAFEDLDLMRIYLYVLASNSAAIATYEKCGFAVEGRLRKHVFKKRTYEDLLVMGLCRQDQQE
jgi:diamine N-acetyltransferase